MSIVQVIVAMVLEAAVIIVACVFLRKRCKKKHSLEMQLVEDECNIYKDIVENSNDGIVISKVSLDKGFIKTLRSGEKVPQNICDQYFNGAPGLPFSEFIYMNKAFANMLGHAFPKDVINKRGIHEFADLENMCLMFHEHYARLKSGKEYSQYTIEIIREDGTTFPCELNATTITLDGETLGLTYARDISKRVALEKKMHHLDKVDTIGQLAAGIAHNINNSLMLILGYAERVQDLALNDPVAERYIGNIVQNTEVAAKFTEQILSFAKISSAIQEDLDLTVLVYDIINMIAPTFDKSIKIVQNFSNSLLPIKADPSQIQAAIINLALNARDAMAGIGGIIAFTTNILEVDNKKYAVLEVQDTGTGISIDVVEKVFDPFFTTKLTGVGMGLASVKGTVEQHNGFINIKETSKKGTIIQLGLELIDGIQK